MLAGIWMKLFGGFTRITDFRKILNILVMGLVWISLLPACEQVAVKGDQKSADTGSDLLQVDVLFHDFYVFLGGEIMMGPAISPISEKNGKFYQYTLNGLMVL